LKKENLFLRNSAPLIQPSQKVKSHTTKSIIDLSKMPYSQTPVPELDVIGVTQTSINPDMLKTRLTHHNPYSLNNNLRTLHQVPESIKKLKNLRRNSFSVIKKQILENNPSHSIQLGKEAESYLKNKFSHKLSFNKEYKKTDSFKFNSTQTGNFSSTHSNMSTSHNSNNYKHIELTNNYDNMVKKVEPFEGYRINNGSSSLVESTKLILQNKNPERQKIYKKDNDIVKISTRYDFKRFSSMNIGLKENIFTKK
jgi:hypothetical protein